MMFLKRSNNTVSIVRWTSRCLSSDGTHNAFNAPHLRPRPANFTPLTPLSLFERSVELFPNQLAYVHGNVTSGEHQASWQDMYTRVVKFASGLQRYANIQPGDVVSIMAPNTPAMLECHMSIPGTGAILHSINTRLDATTIAYQLHHCESKVVLVDSEFNTMMQQVQEKLVANYPHFKMPRFVLIHDAGYQAPAASPAETWITNIEYEHILNSGDIDYTLKKCTDEFDALTLNYTSGTTGNPKGVVTSHRGAYINAIGNMMEWNIHRFAKYLWLVPMFHCNGWCFPWTLAACSGTSFLVRQVRAPIFFDLIDKYKIEFFGGAPIIMGTLLTYPERKKFTHPVKMWTAGSPPPPSVIRQFQDELGIQVQTVYGLTETYGPCTSHIIDPEWKQVDRLSDEDITNRSIFQSRDILKEDIQVMNPVTMKPVPGDSKTLGEVMIRGNIVMKGYLKNPQATDECFTDGWFHTGDLAVNHGRGRFEIKDRSKDIIISGGENISSVEVENILMTHPALLEVAVVAKPDEKWGEVPAAFVVFKPNQEPLTPAELTKWSRTKMAAFQSPKHIVILHELPKTSTGKVQKHELRKQL